MLVWIEVVTSLELGKHINLHLKPIRQHLQHSLHLALSLQHLEEIVEGGAWLRGRIDGLDVIV